MSLYAITQCECGHGHITIAASFMAILTEACHPLTSTGRTKEKAVIQLGHGFYSLDVCVKARRLNPRLLPGMRWLKAMLQEKSVCSRMGLYTGILPVRCPHGK